MISSNIDYTCYKKTEDDWHPTFAGNQVEVSILKYRDIPLGYKVCVWGDDDCGYEREFTEEWSAICEFLDIVGMDFVNKDSLKRRGFTHA